MTMVSDGTITVEASDLVAGGDVTLQAKEKVALLSKKQVTNRTETVNTRGGVWFLPSENGTRESTDEELVQTSIRSGGVMRIDGDAGVDIAMVILFFKTLTINI